MNRAWTARGERAPSAPMRHAGLLLLLALLWAAPTQAAATGKIQGRILSADSGEPLGFAEVVLLPADTTLRRVGGLTNADGTYLIEATPGRYTLQVRALSYARKLIPGIVIEARQLLPFSTALAPEAIQIREVVVEARARRSTDASLLVARRKATAVGDAVSAEQVRKTPDKDAAEVLRRVTGLSVSDGKYVFVRGLGERYSSTEVDGVRIVSPELNKRVVPLDLLPANLLDHVVVQKTYTADRPGEFGGGDVQVQTRDFPGARTWSFSVGQTVVEDLTFHPRLTYAGSPADLFGFGASDRTIPTEISAVAGDRPLNWSERKPEYGFKRNTLAYLGRSFDNVWSPATKRAVPNGTYALTYGDEFKLFRRPLGIIESWSFSRSYSRRDETQRLMTDVSDTTYDYAVTRDVATAQLGGVTGLSYRLSPSHSLHLRGFYTNSADDEVRTYIGQDHNRTESASGTYYRYHGTRLMYVERGLLTGAVEGRHEFKRLGGADLTWRFDRSRARRQQPDRREVRYEQRFDLPDQYPDGYWCMPSVGTRQFGDLRDEGRGTRLSGGVPYRLGRLGSGRITLGYDHQVKERRNAYRRFDFHASANADIMGTPEEIYAPSSFDSTRTTAWVEERTDSLDNYRAHQRIWATYLSVDVPLGHRGRANLGIRNELGYQDVQTTALYAPSRVTSEGKLDNRDWLPSANLTWGFTDVVNLRLAASRTLSRPDLTELSPTRGQEEYSGGYMTAGNPNLKRARIDNYDVRLEAFPGLSEVLAAGYFYKRLREPIEQVLQANTGPLVLMPDNQVGGINRGVELEARLGLGRVWRRMKGLALNSNASFISSNVRLKPTKAGSELGSLEHPLQGQAAYLLNLALSYTAPGNRFDASVLLGATGKRLYALGIRPLPDIYDQPLTTVDAALNWKPRLGPRVKVAGRNLLDREVLRLQGGRVITSFHNRRTVSLTLAFGS